MRKISLLQSVRIYLGEKPSYLELIFDEIERGSKFSFDNSLDLSKNSKDFEKSIGEVVNDSIDGNSKIADKIPIIRDILIKHGFNLVNRESGNDKNLMANLYLYFTNVHFFYLLESYQQSYKKHGRYRILSVQGWFYHFLIMDDEYRRLIFFDENYHLFWPYYIPRVKNKYLERGLQTAIEEKKQLFELNIRYRKENEVLTSSNLKTEIKKVNIIYNPNEHNNSIIFENDAWIITFDGKTTPLKNSLGMRYIVYLINNSNHHHHVLDWKIPGISDTHSG